MEKVNESRQYHVQMALKINEIVDWINKQSKISKNFEKMMEQTVKMKQAEHKMTMEFARLSKKLIEKQLKEMKE